MQPQVVRGDAARYRRLKRLGLVAAALYVALAAVPKPFRPLQPEWFPFFSWSLFSNIPNDARDFGVRVLVLDGEALDPPLFFEQLEARLPGCRSQVVHRALQRVGASLEAGEAEDAAALRHDLERGLFGARAVEYELLRRHYLYYDLLVHGRLLSERPVGRYSWPGAAP